MPNLPESVQHDVDGLLIKLYRRGLPHDYVQRVGEELQAHYTDAYELNGHVREDIHQLEAEFVRSFRSGTLSGNYPVLGVLVIPSLLSMVLLLVYFAPVMLLSDLVREQLPESMLVRCWSVDLLISAFHRLGSLLPFALAAWIAARWCEAAGLNRWWRLASVALPTLLVLLSSSYMTLPTSAAGDGMLGFMFAFPAAPPQGEFFVGGAERMIHALLPVALGLYVMRKRLLPHPEPIFIG